MGDFLRGLLDHGPARHHELPGTLGEIAMMHRARHVLTQRFPAPPAIDPIEPEGLAVWTAHETHEAFASVHDLLCRLVEQQDELLALMRRKDTKQIPIVIGAAPYILRSYGYRHSRLWLAASTPITVNDPAGSITYAAGWNLLDLRDGTELTAAANTNALLELTDELVVR